MSTTTEEKTVETPKGAAAFDAARASLSAQSQDPAPQETPVDPESPEQQPTEPTEKPADQPTETGGNEDTLLTTEEVSKLTPKERENYDRMNRAFTQKTQDLASKRKEIEAWIPTIEALKQNPNAAVEQMAKQLGYKLSREEAAQVIKEEALAEIPEELRPLLGPVVEKLEQRVLAKVEERISPLKQGVDQVVSQAVAAETESTLKAFSAEFPGWEKHEAAMIEMGRKIQAAPGTTDYDYLKMLHRLVTADLSEAEKTKKVVEKINKSAESSEQKRSGVSEERVAHAMPPPEKRSFRDAYEAAKRGEVWEK